MARSNEDCWKDDANWGHSWLFPNGFYFARDDSRFLVPKKQKYMGWTVNMAHPAAPLAVVGTIVGVAGVCALKSKGKLPNFGDMFRGT